MCEGSRKRRGISPTKRCGLAVGGMCPERTPLVQSASSFSRTSSPSESTITPALTNGIPTSSVRSKESAQASPATNSQIQRTIITLSGRGEQGNRPRKLVIANLPTVGLLDDHTGTSIALVSEIDPSTCRCKMYRRTFGNDHCRETSCYARMRAGSRRAPLHEYVGVC